MLTGTEMRPWYCAQTEPNQEFDAKLNLERRGFVTFLPVYLVKTESRNIRRRLLFRNYVFVSLDHPDHWPQVQATPGIYRMLTSQPNSITQKYHQPATIASDAIESLREQALSFDEIRRGKPTAKAQLITEGCFVKVLSGVFKDEESAQKALVHWADEKRAELLLSLFNRRVRVQFYQSDLALVTE